MNSSDLIRRRAAEANVYVASQNPLDAGAATRNTYLRANSEPIVSPKSQLSYMNTPLKPRYTNAVGQERTPATTPSAPIITSIVGIDTALIVYFTAPKSNGGSPITNYEYSIDDGDTFIRVSDLQFTITNLINGMTYNIVIRAANSMGPGPNSNVMDGTPMQPMIFRIEVTDPDSDYILHLSQTAPSAIIWGDGTISYSNPGDNLHTYSKAATYTLSISSSIGINHIQCIDGPSAKTIELVSWGDMNIRSTYFMFSNCTELVSVPATFPLTVTATEGMFKGASLFNSDISAWDVSNVTNMREMFHGATAFNQNISNWDVHNVTNMASMFNGAATFNQDLSAWNVMNVICMSLMFNDAKSFNSPLKWGEKTRKVTFMTSVFSGASSFNQDISGWDVSKVVNMANMFKGASAFNQDISGWNVGKVTNMSSMFSGAICFNQELSSWDVSRVTNMSSMFSGAKSFNKALVWGNKTCNVTNMCFMFHAAAIFNQDISGWDVSNVESMQHMFYLASSFDQDLSGWDVKHVKDARNIFSKSGMAQRGPNFVNP